MYSINCIIYSKKSSPEKISIIFVSWNIVYKYF